MRRDERSGVGTIVAFVFALVLVGVAGGLLWWMLTGGAEVAGTPEDEPTDTVEVGDQGTPKVKDFADYTWAEVSEISSLIAHADSDEAGRAIAESFGILVGCMRQVTLDNGLVTEVVVIGIRHDVCVDGSLAGLTLMVGPIAEHAMNTEATNVGGWEASEVRAWLATDAVSLLPDDLASHLVGVQKLTNNAGVTDDVTSVTETTDYLWLLSAREVVGTITWFVDEYGSTPSSRTDYTDFTVYDAILNAEGTQYEYFEEAGVLSASGGAALGLTYGGQGLAWWYRSAYPYSFTGDDASFFYQVMTSGYPASVGDAASDAGIVVGFCL